MSTGLGPLTDPLAGLRDYHLPEPIPWWPPAPGWWLLAGLALAGLAGLHLARRRARQRRAPAALALRELAELRDRYRRDGDGGAYLRDLSQLLRRFALVRFPAERPGGLCGEPWLAFLAAHDEGGALRDGVGRRLLDAPYRPTAGADAGALGQAVEAWLRRNARVASGTRR